MYLYGAKSLLKTPEVLPFLYLNIPNLFWHNGQYSQLVSRKVLFRFYAELLL